MTKNNLQVKYEHLIGQKFGKWVALEVTDKKAANGSALIRCQCSCPEKTIRLISVSKLLRGETNSCGCNVKTHGESRTPLYKIWAGIKDRTTNPDNKSFYNYGGRGIQMCKEWLDDYQTFRDWSLENGYKKGLSVDRINNNGNYEPSNCRWTDSKTQGNNTRKNNNITINNITKTLAEWCRFYNIGYTTVRGRLDNGWSIEEAFEIVPKESLKQPYEINIDGSILNLKQACDKLKLNYEIVRQRIGRKWTVEEALEITPREKKIPAQIKVVIENTELNLKQACEKLNFNYSLAKSRVSRGWTAEEALEIKSRIFTNNHYEIEINNSTYSLMEACKLLNIDYHLAHGRIRKGWTIDEALELKERYIEHKRHEICIDNKIHNLKEACTLLNKTYGKVLGRIKLGWTVEQALELVKREEQPIQHKLYHKVFVDGVAYSLTEACRILGKNRSTIHRRISKQGMSIYEALGIQEPNNIHE